MLQQTKTTDSGIKLEVNEKILDACTDLMLYENRIFMQHFLENLNQISYFMHVVFLIFFYSAIKILVQKSRKVQKEIIEAGKGTASSKEFYKVSISKCYFFSSLFGNSHVSTFTHHSETINGQRVSFQRLKVSRTELKF